MCEFCHKHGEGKKWYLEAKNYAADLLSDVKRQEFIRGFMSPSDDLSEAPGKLEQLHKAPALIQSTIRRTATAKAKKEHFGQVLPIEDVAEIFDFVNSIVRIPCICRYATLGERARYCYSITLDATAKKWAELFGDIDASYLYGPDMSAHEQLTKEQALQAFAEHEKEGLCHSVWTFVTPFIGGLCNCDRVDCMAMQATVNHGMKMMFRAEYVAAVDKDACSGCRACMRMCQFGALGFSAATRKAAVDQRACYGCGVCRAACAKKAIALRPRREVAAVADLW